MSKVDENRVILQFLAKSNRPFAFNDIYEQCGKHSSKAAVQKVLDSLVGKAKLSEKCFGKLKVYFIKQSTDGAQLKQQLKIVQQKLTHSLERVKQKQAQCRELEAKLKQVVAVRSCESLEQERSQLLENIREMNEKLRKYETSIVETKYSPKKAKEIEKRYDNVVTAYRKRKRMCNDMLDAIMEGYPKSKKILIEDVGIETDEAIEFKIELKH